MNRISSLKNKNFLPLHNILAIAGMAVFAIIANQLNWWQDYTAFIMIPLLGTYFIGKYVSKKEQEK
ncbi:hypothetical protein [Mesonia aquimarina]|uniref:hypothetical protein n=1 Tax=Mesonia aquimarina TaxID=1504967 RepID=UPI000EF60524|nr:hypothetical protein [Mesonia aquimarina]